MLGTARWDCGAVRPFRCSDGPPRAPGGCPFIHASLQSADAAGAIYAIVRAYKRHLRAGVLALLNPDRPTRDELADQIVLLVDGAVTESYLQGIADPIGAGKRAATTLLRAAEGWTEPSPTDARPRRQVLPGPTEGSARRRDPSAEVFKQKELPSAPSNLLTGFHEVLANPPMPNDALQF